MKTISGDVASKLFGASIVALVFVIYGLIALRRKSKFRALAPRLNATHKDTGLFAPGEILGGDFSIAARTVGVGKYKKFRTTLKMSAPKAPGAFLLKAPFFENYPNWAFAKSLGTIEERVFIVKVSLPRYVDLTLGQRDALSAWLGKSSFHGREIFETLKRNRISEIDVSNGSVTVDFSGIVFDFNRLQESLNVLRRFAV